MRKSYTFYVAIKQLGKKKSHLELLGLMKNTTHNIRWVELAIECCGQEKNFNYRAHPHRSTQPIIRAAEM